MILINYQRVVTVDSTKIFSQLDSFLFCFVFNLSNLTPISNHESFTVRFVCLFVLSISNGFIFE